GGVQAQTTITTTTAAATRPRRLLDGRRAQQRRDGKADGKPCCCSCVMRARSAKEEISTTSGAGTRLYQPAIGNVPRGCASRKGGGNGREKGRSTGVGSDE